MISEHSLPGSVAESGEEHGDGGVARGSGVWSDDWISKVELFFVSSVLMSCTRHDSCIRDIFDVVGLLKRQLCIYFV